jgi:DNA-binding response OmpR family regulator
MTPLGTILLVEDSQADAFLVGLALKQHSVECKLLILGDGDRAIQLLDDIDWSPEANVPRLMLTDLYVPKSTGCEVLRRWRASPKCKLLPAIIYSASDTLPDRFAAEQAGATEYFVKPFDLDGFLELGRSVRRLLDESTPA